MIIVAISLLLLVLFNDQAVSSKLPKTWKICRKSDPEINECLKVAVENAIHDLKDGNPSLGVLPLDPLRFNKILIDQGNGPVSLKLEFIDLDIIGFTNMKITSFKNNWKEMQFEGIVPSLIFDGKYTADGKVLVLPVKGDGHCRYTFDNFVIKATLKLKEFEKGGHHFLEVTDFSFNMETDRMHVQFDNLFNGDKALGESTNAFLNQNWKEILNELKPSISKAFGSGYKEISNRIFSKIPIEEFSPA
ncbi:hypothetical protein O3M35_008808 [Rhynocoris fuscipes]|uniref:Uncharacterized protein n=1 Tax=Rhynocoris fuscipes TaxID=488301 RepID=A0AAW1DAA5_9HEMI